MADYSSVRYDREWPRLPLEGALDLTYRCNNSCRHCWVSPPSPEELKKPELSFEEIRRIVEDARTLGCRVWSLSGGEPMLRPDFEDILELVIARGRGYAVNTNGTLITPGIARRLRAPGVKMIALYGPTAAIHDDITRNPGSFEAALRGLARLKEAGARFVVQIVPLRRNYPYLKDMIALAESWSPHWKLGASWIFLSASGDPRRNREIAAERLSPEEAAALDFSPGDETIGVEDPPCRPRTEAAAPGMTAAACFARRREFHVDPYGGMSFCGKIKDPALRVDLRTAPFREAWETELPRRVEDYRPRETPGRGCAGCLLSAACDWCAAYAYLEERKAGDKVDYLCAVAEADARLRADYERAHVRHYRIAGITLRVESDLPFAADTYQDKLAPFAVDGPGPDTVRIRHRFGLPDLRRLTAGEVVYARPPWIIRRNGEAWHYLGVMDLDAPDEMHLAAVFSRDYARGTIYHASEHPFRRGRADALTLFPTDQILVSQLLLDRGGCYLHAAGVILDGRGFLFLGHSGAGKSTLVKMLKDRAEILCDDRVIVRKGPEGMSVHGSWSHGEVPHVSPSSAPLEAIFFLEKSSRNHIRQPDARPSLASRLASCLIKPLVSPAWWAKSLELVDEISRAVPCLSLEFDQTGRIVKELERFAASRPRLPDPTEGPEGRR
jgi:MoaA/NifB/PqqE/SkfB family radical SAM enzyme